MMSTLYDAAVIGTGPAGGMAACSLARGGAKTIVLDRAVLPRHKPCGGAMPMRVTPLIPWDISPWICASVTTQSYFNNYRDPVTCSDLETPMLLVNRSEFDFHFIEKAQEFGGDGLTLRQNFALQSVVEFDDEVLIIGNDGEEIRAKYVIGADGATSRTARSLGLSRKAQTGAAIDVEIEVLPEVYDAEQHRASFNLFCVPNGYGWIFPKNGFLSCGVAVWREQVRLGQAMDEFLEKSLPPNSIQTIKRYGHPVPLFGGHHDIATRRVCLAGDAAQLVDAVLGEGIYYAVKSGALAAEVILNLLHGRTEQAVFSPALIEDTDFSLSETALLFAKSADCSVYQKLVRRGIARELNMRRISSLSFFNNPDHFYKNFIGMISY